MKFHKLKPPLLTNLQLSNNFSNMLNQFNKLMICSNLVRIPKMKNSLNKLLLLFINILSYQMNKNTMKLLIILLKKDILEKPRKTIKIQLTNSIKILRELYISQKMDLMLNLMNLLPPNMPLNKLKKLLKSFNSELLSTKLNMLISLKILLLKLNFLMHLSLNLKLKKLL